MYIAVLHLRHLPHRLIIFIYDHKDIFYVPQKVITHEYINHDHCVYSFIFVGQLLLSPVILPMKHIDLLIMPQPSVM